MVLKLLLITTGNGRKMTEMQQRASIEFERQRHLANWLIESSPHMPTPTPAQQKQLQQQLVAAAAATTGGGKKTATGGGGGKFKQSPMYLLAKIGHNLQAVGGGLGGGGGGGVGTAGTGANGAGQPPNSLAAASSTFNSQTNLPLQILAPGGGGRDGSKPKLRRFNSHDTSANMFSVAEFENARLARRNELENAALLRQRQRYKLNSLSSGGAGGGGDCSTGESKGSKLSNESVTTTEPLIAEQFLERFSLPRVIRLSYTSSPTAAAAAVAAAATSGNGDHTMTSSSSAESSSTAERPASGAGGLKKSKKSKGGLGTTTTTTAGASGGDLFLLYRYMKGYKSYHVFNTKASTNRKKGYKIPQDFPGYFSFINEKGAASATVYTTIVQLVRDQVYKFLSLENLAAYTESHADNFSHKAHYVKATAKAGQVYRLLAVFQDGDHKTASASHKDTTSSLTSERHIGGREKERGKYAQLLDDNRQIYYVSLSAKGKFYEIEQHSAPVLQKPGCGGAGFGHHHHQQQNGGGTNNTHNSNNNPLQNRKRELSRDCVHRIGFIMQSDVSLPLNLRLISPQNGLPSTVPEYVTIAKCSEENFLIACPLDEQQLTSTLTLTKLHLAPQMKFAKCTMGFESEQHMLLNPNVQTVLKFCQFNCDNFLRIVDHETNAIELQQMVAVAAQQQQHRDREPVSPSATLTTTTGPSSLGSNTSGGGGGPGKELSSKGSDVLRAFGRLFGGGSGGGGDRNGSGHEKEDSIIFLSKNDLESLECGARTRGDHHEDHQQNHHYQHHHHHHHHSLDDRSFDGSSRQELAHQPHSLPAGGFSEKMKVFTAKGGAGSKAKSSSRWFKGLGGGGKATSGGSGGHHHGRPISPTTTVDDEWDKRTSLDRYKDMSKLIQERFGTLGLSGVTSQRATSSSDILLGGGGGTEDELVSLNPAPGCGSAEKILSSGYESDSTSCPGGGTVGMQKSRSLQHIGQRDGMASAGGGKNRPDLVTNISGSVEGGGGDDDDDDRLSELDGDTLFFPLRTAAHQQSFMTQKLYSEFHVKTKQYSKSSSSIQQLLHLASGSGALAHGKAGKQRGAPVASGKNRSTSNEVILSFEDLRYMNREEEEPSAGKRGGWSSEQEAAAAHRRLKSVSLRVQQEAEDENRKRNSAQVLEDDLPYSSVRDSIVLHEPDVTTVPAESIYAEICNDVPAPTPPPGGSTGRPLVPHHSVTINTGAASVRAIEKRFVSIRINVPPCDSLASGGGPVVSLNPAGGGGAGRSGGSSTSNSSSSRCSSAVSSPIEDNIYNTIK
ncbi:uncharacterized protein LOC131211744 [Anopheles bellator]|uniref:uncharacterized protein LOC131211744 n=1 Tax=Anopheles bellator TaxID=139047 RepID=UPI002649EEC8|nr:uncharacterized protein LOC131211744 [Anopheles bellator]